MLKRIQVFFVAALVAGGLSFGAAQLRAGEMDDECGWPYHGPCDQQGQCYDLCIVLFPDNGGEGHCFVGPWCCACAEK